VVLSASPPAAGQSVSAATILSDGEERAQVLILSAQRPLAYVRKFMHIYRLKSAQKDLQIKKNNFIIFEMGTKHVSISLFLIKRINFR
jgi:hypothetical protein